MYVKFSARTENDENGGGEATEAVNTLEMNRWKPSNKI